MRKEFVALSTNAIETLEYAGLSAEQLKQDVRDVAAARDVVLDRCLDGVETADVESGWREYVEALDACSWASDAMLVAGGIMLFEDLDTARVARAQR